MSDKYSASDFNMKDLVMNMKADELAEDLKRAKQFEVRDSGKREEFDGGMVRDTAEGKQRPDLMRDGPMFLRWMKHLTKGAIKYKPRNWMLAVGDVEYERFLESTDRHFNIWYTWMKYGVNIEDPEHPTKLPLAEDHAAAVFFNINGAEYVREKIVARDLSREMSEMIDKEISNVILGK